MADVRGVWLGRRRYEPVHELQLKLHEAVRTKRCGGAVLLLEHDPVITLGRGSHQEHVLASRDMLRDLGVDLVEVGRGGDVTLHAPGQLVGYPIVELSDGRRDVRRYVGDLVETMRRIVGEHGVESGPAPGLVGLWTDAERPGRWQGPEAASSLSKLGAVGVRISRWVTMHGFALNLMTDLRLFGLIVPCGIRDHGVTSLASLTEARVSPAQAAPKALAHLAELLALECRDLEDASSMDLDAVFQDLCR